MVELTGDLVKQYINKTSFSPTSLISIAIAKQPNIVTNFEKINKIDAITLQTKVKNFMDDDTLFNDQFKVIITVILSNLMYKNDIIPELVYDILIQLDETNITIDELKDNSQRLIDSLVGNLNDEQKGGGFGNIIGSLFSIGIVIYTTVLNYSLFTHIKPVVETTISDVLITSNTLMDTHKFLTASDETCSDIPTPEILKAIDTIGMSDFKMARIYELLVCISNGRLNSILTEKPEFIEKDIPEFTEQFAYTATSKALVEYRIQDKELVVLGRYLDTLDGILGGLIVYDGTPNESNINVDQTLANFKHIASMPSSELSIMIQESPQKANTNINPLSFKDILSNILSASSNDIITFGYMVADKLMNTKRVLAINIIDSYIYTIQDFCTQKVREIEDLKLTSERKLADFLKKVFRAIANLREFIRVAQHLIWLNGIACSIIIYYSRIMFKKVMDLRRGQQAIEGNIIEETELSNTHLMLTQREERQGKGQKRKRVDTGIDEGNIIPGEGRTRKGVIESAANVLESMKNSSEPVGGKKHRHKTRKNKKNKTRSAKREKKQRTRYRQLRKTKRS